MKHKSSLFLCLLALCIFLSYNGYAQTPDSLTGPHGMQIQDFKQQDADTALQKKYLKENEDVLKWKQSREFYYMHYLDSLLRKQKDLRTDTVSINEKTGRINRVRLHQRSPSSINVILNSWPLKIFFWLLAIIFIIFISYKVFFKNEIFASRKKVPAATGEEALLELNEISAYDTFIAQAEKNEELNLATRYLFLKTLKSLSDRGFINFTTDKTNKEYLKEMEQHHYYAEFRELTRDYEYVWYGKYLITKQKYQKLKEEFNFFNKKV